MRSAESNLFVLGIFLGTALFASSLHAAEVSVSELEGIKTRLAKIEGQQQEILAKEDKILEELDRIRIWVHRK